MSQHSSVLLLCLPQGFSLLGGAMMRGTDSSLCHTCASGSKQAHFFDEKLYSTQNFQSVQWCVSI